MAYANGTQQPAPAPQPEPTILERGSGASVIWPKGGAE